MSQQTDSQPDSRGIDTRSLSRSYHAFGMVARRVMAAMIDVLILVAVLVGHIFFSPSALFPVIGWIAIVFLLGYFPVLDGFYGATLGKKVVGVRVVDDNGRPVGLFRGIARTLIKPLESPGVFALVILLSRDNQSLSDILTSTFVVKRRDLT